MLYCPYQRLFKALIKGYMRKNSLRPNEASLIIPDSGLIPGAGWFVYHDGSIGSEWQKQ